MSYPTCGHRMSDGILCSSPTLPGQKLCYFRQRNQKRRKPAE
jgi:hypothetical protein